MNSNGDPRTAQTPPPATDADTKDAPISVSQPGATPKAGSMAGAKKTGTQASTSSSATSSAPATSDAAAEVVSKEGLTSDDAHRRLAKFGPNAMPDTSVHPLLMALKMFWEPVPWMLEVVIVLELALGKYVEAAIIALLLVFNAALGLFQQSRAQATLAALKSRLAMTASVRRDGAWKTVPTAELAPGDIVKLSLGGVVAADVKLTSGEVLLDQSMLTGESVPVEAGAGVQTFAGALVRRGEAEAEVTANRRTHQIRTHRRTRWRRPRRELPAKGRAPGRIECGKGASRRRGGRRRSGPRGSTRGHDLGRRSPDRSRIAPGRENRSAGSAGLRRSHGGGRALARLRGER